MTPFQIGGETIAVSLLNFKTMKAVWPAIEAATLNPGLVSSTEAVLDLVSKCGQPQYSVDQLEEKLTPAETLELPNALNALLVEIGLAKPKGEAKPAEGEASPSTATSTPSSPESLSGSDQPTGMA